MGFLDFFSNNISTISVAKDVFTSGLDSATATLEKGGVTIDQAADAFTADQPPPESLDVPPTAEFAPAATFYEPVQYFGNYSLIDPKFQPVSNYVEDTNFLYAKEISSFTPRLTTLVNDIGKIVTLDPPSTLAPQTAVSDAALSSAVTQTSSEEQQSTTDGTPVKQVLTAPLERFNFAATALNLAASGESALGGRILGLTSSLDELMSRATSVDPSTKEGQAELAQIQISFSQAQRFLQALTDMMDSFNQLQRTILQNR